MEDMPADEDNVPEFRPSDLDKIFKTRLEQLGPTVSNIIYTTRLKHILFSEVPDLRDTFLLFEKGIDPALKKACERGIYVMHLIRASHVVHREMFETRSILDGAFQADSQKTA